MWTSVAECKARHTVQVLLLLKRVHEWVVGIKTSGTLMILPDKLRFSKLVLLTNLSISLEISLSERSSSFRHWRFLIFSGRSLIIFYERISVVNLLLTSKISGIYVRLFSDASSLFKFFNLNTCRGRDRNKFRERFSVVKLCRYSIS